MRLEARFRQVGTTLQQLGAQATAAGRQLTAGLGTAVTSVTSSLQAMSTAAVAAMSRGLTATRTAILGTTNALASLATTMAGTAALMSVFARGSDEMRAKLEGITLALLGGGAAFRILREMLRFVLTRVGLVTTALGGLIAVAWNWERVSQVVVDGGTWKAWDAHVKRRHRDAGRLQQAGSGRAREAVRRGCCRSGGQSRLVLPQHLPLVRPANPTIWAPVLAAGPTPRAAPTLALARGRPGRLSGGAHNPAARGPVTRGQPLVAAPRRRRQAIRPDVHKRFVAVVQRGRERAEREQRRRRGRRR